MQHWLMKTEPNSYSIKDLQNEENQTEHWDGVRNYQARNFMKEMNKGDLVFFYHSVVRPPGIVGVAEVVREAYPDFTQFDPNSKYFDPKSKEDNPRWIMVDVKFVSEFKDKITLESLKSVDGLGNMTLLQKGSRLSIQKVSKEEWEIINSLK